MAQVFLYDTTLRDGAQMEGISYSVEDKLRILRRLDDLGVHYIEGGWPGANPRDSEFFQRAKSLRLTHAQLAAFASTRRAYARAEDDPTIRALEEAHTTVCTLVGKSWDLHVTRVLETTLEENLNMIADSVRYLKGRGRTVFFDAEHFFDGFKADADYALQCLRAAAEAGADCLVLCDTNGGAITSDVTSIVQRVASEFSVPLGIHVHNDCELAVANSIAAIVAGAVQVQGT
ncbi:MAG: (R)-citramalate synthase, partial [Dehalococcoidia bacterium]|nr:(R)-citramalate synthase [Dehalococcoidia bacterium]